LETEFSYKGPCFPTSYLRDSMSLRPCNFRDREASGHPWLCQLHDQVGRRPPPRTQRPQHPCIQLHPVTCSRSKESGKVEKPCGTVPAWPGCPLRVSSSPQPGVRRKAAPVDARRGAAAFQCASELGCLKSPLGLTVLLFFPLFLFYEDTQSV
jgi:hypothetical protein